MLLWRITTADSFSSSTILGICRTVTITSSRYSLDPWQLTSGHRTCSHVCSFLRWSRTSYLWRSRTLFLVSISISVLISFVNSRCGHVRRLSGDHVGRFSRWSWSLHVHLQVCRCSCKCMHFLVLGIFFFFKRFKEIFFLSFFSPFLFIFLGVCDYFMIRHVRWGWGFLFCFFPLYFPPPLFLGPSLSSDFSPWGEFYYWSPQLHVSGTIVLDPVYGLF